MTTSPMVGFTSFPPTIIGSVVPPSTIAVVVAPIKRKAEPKPISANVNEPPKLTEAPLIVILE
jgi:hypothetical protein